MKDCTQSAPTAMTRATIRRKRWRMDRAARAIAPGRHPIDATRPRNGGAGNAAPFLLACGAAASARWRWRRWPRRTRARQLPALPSAVCPDLPNFAPKAKRCLYFHLVGAPPQMETFDYKPKMQDMFDKDLPESIRNGQRLTTMTSGQTRFPIAPSVFKFAQYGKSGAWVSELLPYTARMVDDIAIIRSMHTEAINHEPALTFFQTGQMVAGRPCIGSWLSLRTGQHEPEPARVRGAAGQAQQSQGQRAGDFGAHVERGFLSGQYAGVSLRSAGDPVLFLNNPDGVPAEVRRRMLDSLAEMNQLQFEKLGDPETRTRIAQYEMAFRMQSSAPELTDLSARSRRARGKLYGEDARDARVVRADRA